MCMKSVMHDFCGGLCTFQIREPMLVSDGHLSVLEFVVVFGKLVFGNASITFPN